MSQGNLQPDPLNPQTLKVTIIVESEELTDSYEMRAMTGTARIEDKSADLATMNPGRHITTVRQDLDFYLHLEDLVTDSNGSKVLHHRTLKK